MRLKVLKTSLRAKPAGWSAQKCKNLHFCALLWKPACGPSPQSAQKCIKCTFVHFWCIKSAQNQPVGQARRLELHKKCTKVHFCEKVHKTSLPAKPTDRAKVHKSAQSVLLCTFMHINGLQARPAGWLCAQIALLVQFVHFADLRAGPAGWFCAQSALKCTLCAFRGLQAWVAGWFQQFCSLKLQNCNLKRRSPGYGTSLKAGPSAAVTSPGEGALPPPPGPPSP